MKHNQFWSLIIVGSLSANYLLHGTENHFTLVPPHQPHVEINEPEPVLIDVSSPAASGATTHDAGHYADVYITFEPLTKTTQN